MFRSSSSTLNGTARWVALSALFICILSAAPVSAQSLWHCATWESTLLNTTDNCVSEPWRDRASDVETFRWKGHDYVMLNRGNELSIYNIDDPANPTHTATSDFSFGTRGDSDYDLVDFDVCDDCRYAVFSHKVKRTVLLDLGGGAKPTFPIFGQAFYDGLDSKIGGFVFTSGSQQYLISATGPGTCGGSNLYTFDSLTNVGFLGCVEIAGAPQTIKGLHTYEDINGVVYLFAGALNGTAHVFRADGIGAGLTLTYVTSPVGMAGRGYELAIDQNNALLASANQGLGEIQIWDIANPEVPVKMTGWTISDSSNVVSLESPSPGSVPTLMVNRPGWPNSTRTFTVESSGPVEFEAEYWTDLALPHNQLPVCAFTSGGALAPDGSALFLSRYAIHQVFDFSDCLAPTPAQANLTITPDPAFPGDTITVRDTTTGRSDEWAVWITKDGGYEAGNQPPPNSSNPHDITFPIPNGGLLYDTVYEAHIEVASADLTPDYATCEANPQCDGAININRTPQATMAVTPSAVVVGESVTLSATAEGNPASNPYTWTIDPPAGIDFYRDGSSTTVTLDQAGIWNFYLEVDYPHDASGGGTYVATDEVLNFNVTSVAADFTISPASPVHTQTITLNGGSSKPVGGNLSFQWLIEESLGSGGYGGCPASQVCTIPGESFNADTWYTITLTVTNNDDSAQSVTSKNVFIGNGAIQPVINFSPSNPEIGQVVALTITGVPGDIDKATWNLGGNGCDGQSSSQVCVPSGPWVDCKAISFKYSSGGTKNVSLTIEVGPQAFSADTVAIPVQYTGSCNPTTPPPTCEYNLGKDSANFGPNGGQSSFSVSAGSGCTWTAVSTFPWITILEPTGGDVGNGNVIFKVDANTGSARTGSIVAGGRSFLVTQEAPWRAANFTMSNVAPEIGEVMTFTVDPALDVKSWNFGQNSCRGNPMFIDCTFLPSGTCNTMQWTYPTAGNKSVTMVLEDGRTQTKVPNVRPVGECCFADGHPDASFESSADEIYAGEVVSFTDTSSKAFPTKAIGVTWTPPTPEIGQDVTFTLGDIVGDIEKVTWDFGDVNCNGASTDVCVPDGLWVDCKAMTFKYASGGSKTVSATVDLVGGGSDTVGPVTVDVANSGSCDGGGGGGCSYSLSKYNATFSSDGGSDFFNVETSAECAWSATNATSWVSVTAGEGVGPGPVAFTVSPNTSPSSRSAIIRVENKNFRITQDGEKGDTAPTAWVWKVTWIEDEEGNPVNQDVDSSTDQHFSHRFKEPGQYRVSLTATNCFGSDSTVDYITVEDAPVEDFVVGAAVSLAGANETQWESDLRFLNPCGENLDVRIEYQPENTNNAGAELVFREFQLVPSETRVFDHITDAIPGLGEPPVSGSVRILSQSDSGCKVLSVSRTFNDTPDGSLGLFVPALPVKRVGREFLDLNGLISNDDYRTNLRLVSYADEDVWVPLAAYDRNGVQVGETREAKVRGQSTKQINEIAEWLGVTDDLAPFSVRADVDGIDVQAFGTVVDNLTGDSVLYLSSFHDEEQIWLVGVASLTGVNNSQWRTDLWLYNPTGDWLSGEVEFVVGDNPSESHGFVWPDLGEHRTKQYLDIVSDQLGLEETRGYIVLTGDGGPAPQVAARTYNLDPLGGTYGLNLRAFGSNDLLQPGEIGFIAGVSNSEDQSVGFRTNVGVLNTDRNGWTTVRITMFNLDGTQAAEPYETTIAPGKLRQFDVFKKLDLGKTTMTGSLMIEAVSGAPIAVYATEIDNRTQDSIFIPAQRPFVGLAR